MFSHVFRRFSTFFDVFCVIFRVFHPQNPLIKQASLAPCRVCGRRFAAARLPKHEAACKSANGKKRRVFDPTKWVGMDRAWVCGHFGGNLRCFGGVLDFLGAIWVTCDFFFFFFFFAIF
jgi:hypothetical protein